MESFLRPAASSKTHHSRNLTEEHAGSSVFLGLPVKRFLRRPRIIAVFTGEITHDVSTHRLSLSSSYHRCRDPGASFGWTAAAPGAAGPALPATCSHHPTHNSPPRHPH